MTRGTMIAAALATACAAAPAEASTLALYDYSAALGVDAGSDPYVDQRIQREIDTGLLQPLRAPIADSGVPLVTRVDLFGGGQPFSRPGTQIRSAALFMVVTTQARRGVLRWQIEIHRDSAYVGGAMPPSDVREMTQILSGRTPAGASPAIRTTYRMDGRTHVVLGFVEP